MKNIGSLLKLKVLCVTSFDERIVMTIPYLNTVMISKNKIDNHLCLKGGNAL